MISSYIKTATRNIKRNKLFSTINIVGLSISMSVGLLMIAFILDLTAYDDFHAKGDRTYRVITAESNPAGFHVDLASTSVKAGKKIKETFSGVEDVTILRKGFSGEGRVGEVTLPITAMWADNSFFKVFTFPLLQGDAVTALKEPYSMVLTEKTAKKIFGKANALGQTIRFDTLNYVVTGVMKDIPKLSHIKFEGLVSFATAEILVPRMEADFLQWESIFQNYVYVVLPPNGDEQLLQRNLSELSTSENKLIHNKFINLSLQPLGSIAMGKNLVNPIVPTMPAAAIWVLAALAFIIILSACFNYTNLSIAASLNRAKEIGIRKTIGALRSHIIWQFIFQSVITSVLAVAFAFVIFLFLRRQFLSLSSHLGELVTFDISVQLIVSFILLAVVVGVMAGFFPALFFSKISANQALKDTSSLKVFRFINMRKTLIVIQYTFSLIFISATLIGYNQYRYFLSFDLGFKTDNILNIRLQGNKSELVKKELAEIPEVNGVSKSLMISSTGDFSGVYMNYQRPQDSLMVYCNVIDEQYIPLHGHKLVAGSNFSPKQTPEETEVIVNEQLLKQFNIGDQGPVNAIGEVINMGTTKLRIIGVVKDFHHGTAESRIEPFAFRYSPENFSYMNLMVSSSDWEPTLNRIKTAWSKIDPVHPLDASFYDEQIERAYNQFSMMIKVIGFLSFLAVSISTLGLFGMVVFTTQTRMKEISIRKIMGASESSLIYLLSREFLFLLLAASLVALPVAYIFFKQVVLANFAYHAPITLVELLSGVVIVIILAFLTTSSQTIKAAHTNPSKVLKRD